MNKMFYILLIALIYLVLSLVIFIKWDKYRIENRIEGLLIGDIIIYIICFPITIIMFIMIGAIKLFNYKIK